MLVDLRNMGLILHNCPQAPAREAHVLMLRHTCSCELARESAAAKRSPQAPRALPTFQARTLA
jgi:hypothetical protein